MVKEYHPKMNISLWFSLWLQKVILIQNPFIHVNSILLKGKTHLQKKLDFIVSLARFACQQSLLQAWPSLIHLLEIIYPWARPVININQADNITWWAVMTDGIYSLILEMHSDLFKLKMFGHTECPLEKTYNVKTVHWQYCYKRMSWIIFGDKNIYKQNPAAPFISAANINDLIWFY